MPGDSHTVRYCPERPLGMVCIGKGNGMVGLIFRDRQQAGRYLATSLRRLGLTDPVVLALPPGGVAVAAEIADELAAPLDVITVKRLRDPSNQYAAYAAVTADGSCVYDYERGTDLAGLEDRELNNAIGRVTREIAECDRAYRGYLPALAVEGRTVILVADGMSTGMRMIAAVRSVRALDPARIVVAVPTASQKAERRLLGVSDYLICLDNQEAFFAVGCSYQHVDLPTEGQIRALLERSRSGPRPEDGPAAG